MARGDLYRFVEQLTVIDPQHGIYDHLLAEILADGHPLAPRELAALVHLESVKLTDQIRRICISRKENVVIEGTVPGMVRGRKSSASSPTTTTPISRCTDSTSVQQPPTSKP